MERQDSTALEEIHAYNIFPDNWELFLLGEIDEDSTAEFIRNIRYLGTRQCDELTVVLSSPGGDVYDGFAVYDAIRDSRSLVTVRALGKVMSMGVIVLQAATGTRSSYPNTRFMIHQGTTQVPESNTNDLKAETIETLQTSKIYETILLGRIREKHPKFPAKKLRAMLEKTTYFSANEMLELGLIDEIIEVPE